MFFKCFVSYADFVDVGDSVLIENQNKMVPVIVEQTSVQTHKGNHYVKILLFKLYSV